MTNMNELPWYAKLLISIGLGVALLFGGYYFLLQSMKDDNAKAQKQLDLIKTRNKQLRDTEPLLKNVEARIAVLQQQIKIQEKIVPKDKDVPGFIDMVQNAATESGIALRYLKPQALVERDQYYGEMPFAVQIDGSYYAILSFFKRVSELERIVNVENIHVGSTKGGGAGGYQSTAATTVVVTCTARTFYSRSK
jgi:type IV pilus assembly protein PilO